MYNLLYNLAEVEMKAKNNNNSGVLCKKKGKQLVVCFPPSKKILRLF